MSDDVKPLKGVDREVFDALVEASTSERADVSFTALIPRGVTAAQTKDALARLKTLKFVQTLTFYGIGPAGRVLRDREIAEMAAAAEETGVEESAAGPDPAGPLPPIPAESLAAEGQKQEPSDA